MILSGDSGMRVNILMTEMAFMARLGRLREAFAESRLSMIETRWRLGALSATWCIERKEVETLRDGRGDARRD